MIFGIFRDFGGAFAASMRTTEGVARCHLHGLGMRYDTSISSCINPILTHPCAKKSDDNPSDMNTSIIDESYPYQSVSISNVGCYPPNVGC